MKNDYPQFSIEIEDLDHQADYGLISRDEYNEALSKVIGLPNGQIETRYWGGSTKVQSAFDWMRQLRQAGYKIGLLSNVGRGFFSSYFTDTERTELFDEVILSSDVGVAKPDIVAYQMIADKLGVKPSECVMVDDTVLNIEAARNAGMTGVWFISVDQAKSELNELLGGQDA